jgi:hypothetical protein
VDLMGFEVVPSALACRKRRKEAREALKSIRTFSASVCDYPATRRANAGTSVSPDADALSRLQL